MKLKKLTSLAIVASSLLLAVTSSASAITIKHDAGVTQVTTNPQRIVVNTEEALDMVNALGLGDRVVGISSSRIDPTVGRSLPDDILNTGFYKNMKINSSTKYLGTVNEPNLEVITALKPDLIVKGTWKGDLVYPKMNAIAPTLGYMEGAPGYYQRALRDLGRVTGKSQVAEQIIQKENRLRNQANAKLKANNILKKYPKVLVFSYINGKAYAHQYRLAKDLVSVGFKQAYPFGSEASFEVMAKESLLNVPSDTLLVLYANGVPTEELNEFMDSAIGKHIKGQTVIYELPKYFPNSGPTVSARTLQTLVPTIINKFGN